MLDQSPQTPTTLTPQQSNDVLTLLTEFFGNISFEELEPEIDELLQCYIGQTDTPRIDDVRDKLDIISQLYGMLEKLEIINVQSQRAKEERSKKSLKFKS